MIVLDTHAWTGWTSGSPRLSAGVREKIDTAADVAVSPISCWEVAMLVANGRIDLGRQPLNWIRLALTRPATRLVPIAPDIAVRAAQLGERIRGDPADRLIIATALQLGAPLVTLDEGIRASGLVETIW